MASITAADILKSEACRRANTSLALGIKPRLRAMPITAAVPVTCKPFSVAMARPSRSSINNKLDPVWAKASRMQAVSPSSSSGNSGKSGVGPHTAKHPAAIATDRACSSGEPNPPNTSALTSTGIQTTPNKGRSQHKPSTRASPISGLASVKTRRAIAPACPYPGAHPVRPQSPQEYPNATSETQIAPATTRQAVPLGPATNDHP